jgi:acetyl-CoA/propionyl-CoA carboxylase biotin carboxyl carrier protein
MFKKILVANRGEIAVRVIRACQELGITAVAIFSEVDRLSRHVQIADETWLLEGEPGKVYLDAAQIVELAKRAGAEAVHPGYGFLAENEPFAELLSKAGITFIGPRPDVIRQMGSKIESRRIMESNGVPVVPGTTEPVSDPNKVKELALKYGYPIAIKASAGGGGRGLRVVRQESEIENALSGAQREGASYFGSGEVYVEKYLDLPRHIEVQVLADNHGGVVHLFERDCSSQRRHQKLLEESPATNLSTALRKRLLEGAVKAARAIGYTSAGTVECLVSGDDFYFLEMNTRVQVEHPVTEFITGIDIVKEQIRIAAGLPLSFAQNDVTARGHAIECRINAEDPYKNFMPSPGTVVIYQEPSLPWVRVDSACYPGYKILPFYDSLLAKLVCWGRDRQEAIARTRLALKEFKIEGVSTTIPFHLALIDDEAFKAGKIYTGYVEAEFKKTLKKPAAADTLSQTPAQQASKTDGIATTTVRQNGRTFQVEVNQKSFNVTVAEMVPVQANNNGNSGTAKQISPRPQSNRAQAATLAAAGKGEILASMHGLVKQVLVEAGQKVEPGQKLLIFEAMKMESEIVCDQKAVVAQVLVKPGQTVETDQMMLILAAEGS